MTKAIIAFAVAASLTPLLASAKGADKTVKPFRMTCEAFLNVSATYKPAVIYWIASVDKLGVREDDQIVVDKPELVGNIVEQCKKAPKENLAVKVRKTVNEQPFKINYDGA